MSSPRAVELTLPSAAIEAETLDEFRAVMLQEINNRGWDQEIYKYRIPERLMPAFDAQMEQAKASEQGITLHTPLAGVAGVAGIITRPKDGGKDFCVDSSRRGFLAKSAAAIAVATAFLTFGKVHIASADCDTSICEHCLCNLYLGCGSTGTISYTTCGYYCDCSHGCFEQVTSGCRSSCPGPSC